MQLNLIAMQAHLSKIVGEGLTYDDVLLIPAYSEVLPREVSIKTSFTRKHKPKRSYSFCSYGYRY